MNSATADPNATNSPQTLSAVRWSDLLCRDLFKLATEADEILRTCKKQGDDEGRIEHRGQRDAYLHAIEMVKRHNAPHEPCGAKNQQP